jgi:hypothetical protein
MTQAMRILAGCGALLTEGQEFTVDYSISVWMDESWRGAFGTLTGLGEQDAFQIHKAIGKFTVRLEDGCEVQAGSIGLSRGVMTVVVYTPMD